MKRFVQFLLITLMLGFFSTTTFSQILMDGESSDWDAYPVLIEAPDNLDGVFPAEVGAIVNDIVDVKTVKAVAMDNVLYFFIRLCRRKNKNCSR